MRLSYVDVASAGRWRDTSEWVGRTGAHRRTETVRGYSPQRPNVWSLECVGFGHDESGRAAIETAWHADSRGDGSRGGGLYAHKTYQLACVSLSGGLTYVAYLECGFDFFGFDLDDLRIHRGPVARA